MLRLDTNGYKNKMNNYIIKITKSNESDSAPTDLHYSVEEKTFKFHK